MEERNRVLDLLKTANSNINNNNEKIEFLRNNTSGLSTLINSNNSDNKKESELLNDAFKILNNSQENDTFAADEQQRDSGFSSLSNENRLIKT
jgi:hypothetical protein